jgi:mannose-6-phosphate isomerase-like protein (cupin superfamily)
MINRSDSIDLNAIKAGLVAGSGGYEVAHESPGLELGVYTLVAPEPDQQQPHADDEVYVVLEGRGTLEIDGTAVPLTEGQAVFVPAGADHRFIGYENLSVLVIFARPHEALPN